jgi:hypothetical protein
MTIIEVTIPEGFDFSAAFDRALKEALAPVGRLEMLKCKPYLSPKEVSELYGISALSLSTWRSRGGGPDYMQPYKNGPVQYTHEAIRLFQEGNRMRGKDA